MTRQVFVSELDRQVKPVRAEYGYTQDVMAGILGISKKTLVQIEKGRSSLGWTGAVAFSTLFSGSQILSGLLGGEASDMVLALAFDTDRPTYPKTMGGKVWWYTVEQRGGFRIQQNMISRHYRVLDGDDGRICSSFDLKAVQKVLDRLEEVR